MTFHGSFSEVISHADGIATCMNGDVHATHDWYYTSEDGGHMLAEPFVAGDRALGYDVKKWRCPGRTEQAVLSQPVTLPPTPRAEVVTMTIVSGGTVQQVTDVLRVDHRRGRVLIRCSPDTTPRWVALAKPRTTS